jgi:phage shock protein A
MSKELEALKECMDEVKQRRDELLVEYRNADTSERFWYAMGQLNELSTTSDFLTKLYDKIREKKGNPDE